MKTNWLGIFNLIIATIVCSIIGLSLPGTINSINGLEVYHWYGKFASYACSMLLFWILARNYKLIKDDAKGRVSE